MLTAPNGLLVLDMAEHSAEDKEFYYLSWDEAEAGRSEGPTVPVSIKVCCSCKSKSWSSQLVDFQAP